MSGDYRDLYRALDRVEAVPHELHRQLNATEERRRQAAQQADRQHEEIRRQAAEAVSQAESAAQTKVRGYEEPLQALEKRAMTCGALPRQGRVSSEGPNFPVVQTSVTELEGVENTCSRLKGDLRALEEEQARAALAAGYKLKCRVADGAIAVGAVVGLIWKWITQDDGAGLGIFSGTLLGTLLVFAIAVGMKYAFPHRLQRTEMEVTHLPIKARVGRAGVLAALYFLVLVVLSQMF